jgi:Fur family ferric uptake transcriptional regulator
MDTYLDKFLRFMNTRGFNVTRQRLRIAEIFLSMQGHHNLEELYGVIRKNEPGIGQTTVYRTLKLLCEAGLALEHQFGDGSARYEPLHTRAHHDHLICQTCGRTVEVHSPAIESLQKQLAAEYGYQLVGHAHYLYGLCPDCRRKKDAPRTTEDGPAAEKGPA